MASLKEVKSRINSINGTLKITSAMKMVASAKLHKRRFCSDSFFCQQTGKEGGDSGFCFE